MKNLHSSFLTRGIVRLLFALVLVVSSVGLAGADPGQGQRPPDGVGNGNENGNNGNHGQPDGKGGGDDQGGDDQGGDHGGGDGSAGGPCGSEAGDDAAVAAVRAAAAGDCDCAGSRNHGRYMSCVAHAVRDAIADGSLRAECSDEIMSCAARSACGRSGFVTCCRTDAGGNTRCSVKRSSERCRAPKGGTACVGAVASCCDACSAGGGCPGSSTTTAPPTTTTRPATTSTTTTPGTTSTSTTSVTSTTTTTQPVNIQCCVQGSVGGAFDTCVLASAGGCTSQGGINVGAGSCSPNPCPPSTSTTTTRPPTTTTTTTTPPTTTTTTRPATTSTTTTAPATTTTSTTAPATTSTTTTAPPTTTTSTTAPPTTSTSTTTTATTSTTTTTAPSLCCPAGRISTQTAAGTLVVGVLTAFPFPAGVVTTLDIDGGDATCKHNVIVPANGFSVPIFCIPALNFTSQVTPLGCESGGGFGNGVLWDAHATTADADVSSVGDTSDGVCNPAGQPCNITAGGASNNTLGDIDTVVGNGVTDPAGVQAAVAIPVDSLTWSAADASCPDSDGVFNDGVDTQISRFQFILRPTTATANASYVDKNGDLCSRGNGTAGPNSTRTCANDHSKPCGAAADCPGSSCGFGAMQGSPAAGPCCEVGQSETLVATGIAFSGGAPLFDLIFANLSPTSVTGCGASVSGGACVLSTDACKF